MGLNEISCFGTTAKRNEPCNTGSIGKCILRSMRLPFSACGAGVFRSVPAALGKRSRSFRLETSWRARRPALCMPLLAVCARFAVLFSYEAVLEEKLCPHTPVHFQAKNKRAINSIFSDTPPCGAGCVQPKCQQRPCLCPLPLAMAALLMPKK